VTRHRESSSIVDAVEIRSVSTGTQRISDDRGMPFFCRGTHIELGLDKTRFAGSSPFLFATVMERFLALYTHLNAYVQVSVILGDDDHPLKVWPPRSGDQVLL
jgi:type VI secretion system protein ImpG